MNILKKILVNTVILISLNSVAQSNKPLVSVFKQSYEYEATKTMKLRLMWLILFIANHHMKLI